MTALESILHDAMLLGYHVTVSPASTWQVTSRKIRVQIVFDHDQTTGKGKIAEQYISKADEIPACIGTLMARIRESRRKGNSNA